MNPYWISRFNESFLNPGTMPAQMNTRDFCGLFLHPAMPATMPHGHYAAPTQRNETRRDNVRVSPVAPASAFYSYAANPMTENDGEPMASEAPSRIRTRHAPIVSVPKTPVHYRGIFEGVVICLAMGGAGKQLSKDLKRKLVQHGATVERTFDGAEFIVTDANNSRELAALMGVSETELEQCLARGTRLVVAEWVEECIRRLTIIRNDYQRLFDPFNAEVTNNTGATPHIDDAEQTDQQTANPLPRKKRQPPEERKSTRDPSSSRDGLASSTGHLVPGLVVERKRTDESELEWVLRLAAETSHSAPVAAAATYQLSTTLLETLLTPSDCATNELWGSPATDHSYQKEARVEVTVACILCTTKNPLLLDSLDMESMQQVQLSQLRDVIHQLLLRKPLAVGVAVVAPGFRLPGGAWLRGALPQHGDPVLLAVDAARSTSAAPCIELYNMRTGEALMFTRGN